MTQPFQIPWNPAAWSDLQRRLRATRWSDAVTSDWSYGVERGFLEHLVDYWANRYDWPERRRLLNGLPHHRAQINGFGIHFLHFRSRDASRIPLLLMNGWPSSFVEFQRLAPMLVAGDPGSDVVIPALPGFGFSDRPTKPYEVEPAELFPQLMTALGYEKFLVAGTDIGAGVATRISLRHPDRVIGAHVSAIAEKPAGPDAPPQTAAERA